MIGIEIKDTKKVILSEVYKILDERKKRGPLGYEQQTSYDYCEKFVVLGVNDALSLLEELQKLGIKYEHACTLVDILPEHVTQVKAICRNEVDEQKAQEVLTIIKRYTQKKSTQKKSKEKER